MVLHANALRSVAALRACRLTAEVFAALLAAALMIRFAFVSTAAQRAAGKTSQTGAGRHIVDHFAARVLAARTRMAEFLWQNVSV